MQRLIVIIFDGQSKARAGLKALRDLDRDGDLSLFEVALAVKGPTGRVRVIEDPDDANFPAVGVGSLTGSVLGALGGPIGIVAGAAAGAMIGFIVNLERAGVTDDFVTDVSTAMAPGKFAVVADVLEESTTPLDERMEPLGGVVFRRTRTEARSIHHNRDVAAHRAEMERLKAERAQANGERLDKIDAALDRVGKKLETALLRQRSSILRREEERDARIRALRAKAEQSQVETRQRLEARIAQLQREYEHQDTDAA